MCGRYTLSKPGEALEALGVPIEALASIEEELCTPRYNIAPTQPILAVRRRESEGELRVAALRWGLIPGWSKRPPERALINARLETVAEKPSFRHALERRRCVVPADGFYEWERQQGRRRPGKPPRWFHLEDCAPFAFAGLWERWIDLRSAHGMTSQSLESCCFLTRPGEGAVAEIHDRMPVILAGDTLDAWLDPGLSDGEALVDMLEGAPRPRLEGHIVSPQVNHIESDQPSNLAPWEPPVEPENLSLF